ncbi:TIGR03086 family metal-binding protein [Kitasatospora griseola]|uniref:TIGR03086 family metal-binding protein n=1 Tax=Kitasatospora griseola TaxID=2064 RepID=UPI003422F7D5
MTTVLDLYARISDDFTALLVGCPPDRWEEPSPCPGWTAWDVAAHVIGNHRRALAGLAGSDYESPSRGEDLLTAWHSASDEVKTTLLDPSRAATMLGDDFGNMPFAAFVNRMACADTLIHTWDFARATRQNERLDAEAVQLATEMLTPEDSDIRLPNAYGPKVAAANSADDQTRLLNFLGRNP